MSYPEVFIVGAARTPIGKFLGSLASLRASDLGAVAIREAMSRAGVAGDQVDEVMRPTWRPPKRTGTARREAVAFASGARPTAS